MTAWWPCPDRGWGHRHIETEIDSSGSREGVSVIAHTYGPGRIGAPNRAADQVLPTPDQPDTLIRLARRGPGLMMPEVRRATRAMHPYALPVTHPGGAR